MKKSNEINVTVSGNINVSGYINVSGVNGNGGVSGNGGVNVNGGVSGNGNGGVNGGVSGNGNNNVSGNISVNGNFSVSSNITVNSNITVGNSEARNITVGGIGNTTVCNSGSSITLRELKSMLPSTRGKKLPGPIQLRKTGKLLISSNAYMCRMEVYKNGFAIYQNQKHKTVLRMEHVGATQFNSVIEVDSRDEPMDDAVWSVAVMMNGEDRLAKMYKANEEPNLESTADAARNDDGETCDMEFDSGVDVEAQVIENEGLGEIFSILSPQQKIIVKLVYVDQWTQEEAAKKLGITRRHLRTQLERAKDKLKNKLNIFLSV